MWFGTLRGAWSVRGTRPLPTQRARFLTSTPHPLVPGPGSHKLPLLPHRPAAEGNHVLMCDYTEAKGVSVPLKPGSATMHHGATLHHTRGNSTETHRRAYILNFRPKVRLGLSGLGWCRSAHAPKSHLLACSSHTRASLLHRP